MCPALFHARRSKYMSKLEQLMLGALATALIAVGVAAQTGTVQPPRDRPPAPHAFAPTGEPTADPSPIETPPPSRGQRPPPARPSPRRTQGATKQKSTNGGAAGRN